MTPPAQVPAITLPLGGRQLTPQQWRDVERLLDEWKAEVLAAARKHPGRAYRLGVQQAGAFADLLHGLQTTVPGAAFGGISPSMREAAKWSETYTLHELNDALNVYVGKIKDALLYGLRGGLNPTAIASLLYKATGDASVNWRMIARTEMARANALGRLQACKAMGYEKVWVPPHIGSCKSCKRLLEGQVFDIDELLTATNYGRAQEDWVPCCPLHPHCRHSYLPYDPDVYAEAMGQYARMEAAGLTDEDRLDEMFDSSGQLKPEYADVDFSAAKTAGTIRAEYSSGDSGRLMDPFAEGLAVAVVKVARRRQPPPNPRHLLLPAEDLRTDLYQREPDPDKVMGMLAALRRGEDLPAPKVSLRDDGTAWVYDGQHRIMARKLNGEHHVLCHCREGMSWDEEAEACRAAIRKTWNAWSPGLDVDVDVDVAKEADGHDLLAELVAGVLPQPEPEVEPPSPTLFDGARLRDDVAMALQVWWERVAGAEASTWSQLLVRPWGGPVEALVDYDALRTARPDWKVLADTDLHFALVAAARKAGQGETAEIAPGLPMDVRIAPLHGHDPDLLAWDAGAQTWRGPVPGGWVGKSLSDVLPEYSWQPARLQNAEVRTLLSSDEYEALVAKTKADTHATVGWHVAPAAARDAILEHGLVEAQPNDRWKRYGAAQEPAGVYVWTDRHRALKWAADMARLVGGAQLARNDVWRIDLTDLPDSARHVDPVLGEQGALYLTLPAVPPERLTLEVTKTAGQLLDVAKAGAAANSGVEHWITVHPHGDSEPGQPVLVRNNSDGTMTVIGGAGGNLNYMRLDPSRRIDRDKGEKAQGAKRTDQPVSAEEHEAAAREREQQIAQARENLAKAQERQQGAKDALHAFARDELGVDLNDPELTTKQRRKLLARLRTSALRTLTYGALQTRDAAAYPTGEKDEKDEKAPKDPAEVAEQAAADGSPAAEDGIERKPRPSMAMSADQATVALDHFHELQAISKVATQQRRVIAGEKQASDALQIDWSLGGQAAKDERRAKAVEQQARTDLARELLEHGDKEWQGKKYNERYRQAFQRGGYDTLDAFSHSVLGRAQLSYEAHKLLGVGGAAQLVAYSIQQQAQQLGKKDLDLDQVQDALKQLTDEQERGVVERGMARVKLATERAALARTELAASERGESLFTTTMARSMASEKIQEAKRGLGAMIGGLEASSALKTALDRQPGEKLKVGGFSSPQQIRDLAARARVNVREGDIVKNGPGQYTLAIDPDRLTGLLRPEPPVDQEKRDRLRDIREGKDFDRLIEAEQEPGPGMVHTLDANQARGKLFLTAAGSGVLGFDPGVGKTHTAIASAMELMAKEPDKGHRALIVAPTNMLRSWRDTIAAQQPGHTVQVVGESAADSSKDTSDSKKRREQLAGDAHFTIIAYESLKSYQDVLDQMHGEGRAHSIVIADELQKAKNESTGNHKAVEKAVRNARDHHGDSSHFWGLTGTPIEKDVSDMHAMVRLAQIAKGEEAPDRKTFRSKYGKLGQDEHIARGDKIRQFRKGLDEHLFRLSAEAAGNELPAPSRHEHKVELDPEHKADLQATVGRLNEAIQRYHETKDTEAPTRMPSFGGRDALMDALYGREDSALARSVADNIEKAGTFQHGGQEYEHKHVVFGSSETSKALFGKDWNKGAKQPGGLHGELERRGVKVFVGHGSMSSAQNEANYKAFLAHQGKAVFLTNDKNNAGISLQFGENKGDFQYGATHMHHFTRPVNNATIQQREARILRKGAQAKVAYHTYSADTPVEMRLQEALDRELRTQDLAANSEQQVAGADTLAHHLEDRGIKAARS